MKDGTLDGIGAALARLKPPMPSGLARGLHFPSGTSGGFRTARRESVQCLCFSFVAMVATRQFFHSFRFQHSQERELFMRIQNSFAAAVAAAVSAVVFSAAFQPAEASIIVIDDFTKVQTQTASGAGGSIIVNDTLFDSFGTGQFDQRNLFGQYPQSLTRGSRTVSMSSSGGQGTIIMSNDGLGSGTTSAVTNSFGPAFANFEYFSTGSTGIVNLTGQQYAGFWIETLNTSATPTGSFKGYIDVTDLSTTVRYTLPSMWPSNTAIGIPFTSFPGINFAQVSGIYMGIQNTTPLSGNTAYNATANFKAISVPEPTQMVSVAAVGAMFGAWRLRKLRRSREVAGDATAG